MEPLIVAVLTIKENYIEDFLKISKLMVESSRKEKGVIAYDLYLKHEFSNEFMFFERYVNEMYIEKHFQSDHFKRFLEEVRPMLICDIKIRRY